MQLRRGHALAWATYITGVARPARVAAGIVSYPAGTTCGMVAHHGKSAASAAWSQEQGGWGCPLRPNPLLPLVRCRCLCTHTRRWPASPSPYDFIRTVLPPPAAQRRPLPAPALCARSRKTADKPGAQPEAAPSPRRATVRPPPPPLVSPALDGSARLAAPAAPRLQRASGGACLPCVTLGARAAPPPRRAC